MEFRRRSSRSCRNSLRADSRVRFFNNPKHESRGEPYRHAALQEARGEIICYLCDRDLWFPDHLEHMYRLLQDNDFAGALSLHVLPNSSYKLHLGALEEPSSRRRILTGDNFVAFSCGGHTLDMYRRLPYGWRTTPPGLWTDQYMWEQFLHEPGCRAVSGRVPTALTFPSPPRLEWSVEQRVDELKQWQLRLATAPARLQLRLEMLPGMVRVSE